MKNNIAIRDLLIRHSWVSLLLLISLSCQKEEQLPVSLDIPAPLLFGEQVGSISHPLAGRIRTKATRALHPEPHNVFANSDYYFETPEGDRYLWSWRSDPNSYLSHDRTWWPFLYLIGGYQGGTYAKFDSIRADYPGTTHGIKLSWGLDRGAQLPENISFDSYYDFIISSDHVFLLIDHHPRDSNTMASNCLEQISPYKISVKCRSKGSSRYVLYIAIQSNERVVCTDPINLPPPFTPLPPVIAEFDPFAVAIAEQIRKINAQAELERYYYRRPCLSSAPFEWASLELQGTVAHRAASRNYEKRVLALNLDGIINRPGLQIEETSVLAGHVIRSTSVAFDRRDYWQPPQSTFK